jgi:hypothetical protein
MAELLNNTFFTIQMGVSFELARLASETSIDSEGLSWGPSGPHRRQLDHGSVLRHRGFTHLAPLLVSIHP